MPTCPAGHDSASSDFCDVCGMRMGGASSPATTQEAAGRGAQPAAWRPGQPPPEASRPTTRTWERAATDGTAPEPGSAPAAGPVSEPGSDQALGSAPGSQLVWTAVVASDRTYYETVIADGGPDAASIQFPAYCPERRFQLAGPEMRIGRHSVSRGLEPEIDLTGPPTDPGVSRLHAALIAQQDGSWAVLDRGSENGTMVNGSEVTARVPVQLHDGDQIQVGAWTVITVHAG